MKNTGLFYGSSSGKTESTAISILSYLGNDYLEIHDVINATQEDLLKYDHLILGIPTRGIGKLQEDWEDFLPVIQNADLSGKIIALFGLGDQESYPDTFADALGTLYNIMLSLNCQIIGSWPADGYHFVRSFALRRNHFVGLVLDEENQADLSDQRIRSWLKIIMPEMR